MSGGIFERSKYYKIAAAEPTDIVEPLGYDFFKPAEEKKAPSKKKTQLVYKYPCEKSNLKVISSRGTPNREIIRFFGLSDAPRKNYYVSGTNLDLINKQMGPEVMKDLRSKFFPHRDREKLHFIEFLGVLSTIPEESLFTIRDYALSTIFIFYEGESQLVLEHLRRIFT
ncbi:unnamed protein product [Sphagnum balticum]